MNKKFILYLGGGAMSGVYGAGVLKKIYDSGMVDKIESIYAGSVGALNAAYLLSNQTELGPTIYWDDLKRNFIFPKNIFLGTLDLIINRWFKQVPKEKAHNVVEINYLYHLIKFAKSIDVKSLFANPIDLYIKVLNIESGDIKYIRVQDYHNLELIKAAVALKPYFFEEVFLKDGNYIDGTIKEPIGLSYLLEKHPGHKIVVILNEPIKRDFRHYLKNFVEGIASSLYPYTISLFSFFAQRESSFRQDIAMALGNHRVLLIYPNFEGRVRPRTTDPIVLKEAFKIGYQDADKVAEFIGYSENVDIRG
jgi:predicted patatin/cPLA2 family phospholipase